jgi:protein gp37
MGEITGISWCHHTRNYWMGCTRVGPGCGQDHPLAGAGGGCYAERMSLRWGKDLWGDDKPRLYCGDGAGADVRRWNRKAHAAGERRRVFINSYADVLDHRVPQEWRNRILADAAECPWLDFLLLTKRIGNAPRMLPSQLPPNVWMGISAVDGDELQRDTPKLARVRTVCPWLSFEPALGPVTNIDMRVMCLNYRWVIWGGESGAKARPIDVGNLERLCEARRLGLVPTLFIKQFGERYAREQDWKSRHGADPSEWPAWARIREFPAVSSPGKSPA